MTATSITSKFSRALLCCSCGKRNVFDISGVFVRSRVLTGNGGGKCRQVHCGSCDPSLMLLGACLWKEKTFFSEPTFGLWGGRSFLWLVQRAIPFEVTLDVSHILTSHNRSSHRSGLRDVVISQSHNTCHRNIVCTLKMLSFPFFIVMKYGQSQALVPGKSVSPELLKTPCFMDQNVIHQRNCPL